MKKLACLIIAATIGSIGPLQATPRMVGQSGDWLIYSFDRGGKETCYVLSVPEDAKPLGVDHGKNYFLVAPGKETNRREPEAIMGYPLKPGSIAELSVGDKKFRMFTKGNAAWVNNEKRTPELIRALKAGSKMVLQATSARGTDTTYVYSLDGITAALDRSSKCN